MLKIGVAGDAGQGAGMDGDLSSVSQVFPQEVWEYAGKKHGLEPLQA
jgi:hypothetical protein